jgi:hypothetical protein
MNLSQLLPSIVCECKLTLHWARFLFSDWFFWFIIWLKNQQGSVSASSPCTGLDFYCLTGFFVDFTAEISTETGECKYTLHFSYLSSYLAPSFVWHAFLSPVTHLWYVSFLAHVAHLYWCGFWHCVSSVSWLLQYIMMTMIYIKCCNVSTHMLALLVCFKPEMWLWAWQCNLDNDSSTLNQWYARSGCNQCKTRRQARTSQVQVLMMHTCLVCNHCSAAFPPKQQTLSEGASVRHSHCGVCLCLYMCWYVPFCLAASLSVCLSVCVSRLLQKPRHASKKLINIRGVIPLILATKP